MIRILLSSVILCGVSFLVLRRVTWSFDRPTVDHLRDTLRKANSEEQRRRDALIDRLYTGGQS